jgi:hypothetical protein
MEAAQALFKYKEKMQLHKLQRSTGQIQQQNVPILHSTQREIEWFQRLCPSFDKKTAIYLKKCE